MEFTKKPKCEEETYIQINYTVNLFHQDIIFIKNSVFTDKEENYLKLLAGNNLTCAWDEAKEKYDKAKEKEDKLQQENAQEVLMAVLYVEIASSEDDKAEDGYSTTLEKELLKELKPIRRWMDIGKVYKDCEWCEPPPNLRICYVINNIDVK